MLTATFVPPSTATAARPLPPALTAWPGTLEEVALVVWKEDIVGWLVVRIRCEGSEFGQSDDARWRITMRF